MRHATSPTTRILLQTLGLISLGLGFAGAVLPLLPTTPFILLSAWCFAKSSPRWHAYVKNHKEFGPLLTNWKNNRSMSKRHKVLAISMVSVSIVGILLTDRSWLLKGSLAIWLSFIVIALLFVKTAPSPE